MKTNIRTAIHDSKRALHLEIWSGNDDRQEAMMQALLTLIESVNLDKPGRARLLQEAIDKQCAVGANT